jgi:hypothetical protein
MRRCLSIAFATALACAALAGRGATAADPTAAGAAPDPGALEALALNIYHEAKGEGRRGMLAVGWVVLNRASDPAFPRRVEDVVTQGCQFFWLCDAHPDEPADGRAWRRALEPPPLKWSILRYGFGPEEDRDATQEAQARGDRRQAAPGRRPGLARPGRG